LPSSSKLYLFSRWFAIFYLVAMFLVLPMYIFGLSLLGPVAIYIGFVPVLVLFIFVIVINVVQNKRIKWLPSGLRNWSFLPEYLRSLEPYDR
jgi:sodium-dependent phosphate cotransporter